MTDFFSLTLALAIGSTHADNLEDITDNAGFLLTKFKTPFLFSDNYYIHYYYNLNFTHQTHFDINNAVNKLIAIIPPGSKFNKEHNTYFRLLNFTLETQNEKVNNLATHKRNKRGLVNGLGSVLKFITGTMDDEDRDKYDHLLNQLSQNQRKLQSQNQIISRTHDELINKINHQLENIQINEQNLASSLSAMKHEVARNSETLLIQNLAQLTLLSNSFTNILENIENSLTFCNLNILHESIISMKELIKLFKINNLEINFENYWEATLFIKPICRVHYGYIDIVLEIANYKQSNLTIVQFVPLPVSNKLNQQIILDETFQNLIVVNSSIVKIDYCFNINHKFFCKTSNVKASKCINNLILNKENNYCKFNDLIQYPVIIRIPNTDTTIINIKQNNVLLYKCGDTHKYLRIGLYKIENINNCYLNNRLMVSNFNYSLNIPLLANKDFKYILSNKATIIHSLSKIDVNNIKGSEISEINWYPTPVKNYLNTLIIIILLIVTCAFVAYIINKYRNQYNFRLPTKLRKTNNKKETKFELETTSLPVPNVEAQPENSISPDEPQS